MMKNPTRSILLVTASLLALAACAADGDGPEGDDSPDAGTASDALTDAGAPLAAISIDTIGCTPRDPQAPIVVYDVDATGTMTGPEGAEALIVINGGSDGPGLESCGAWVPGFHDSPLSGITCVREQAPGTASWTLGVFAASDNGDAATFEIRGMVTLAESTLVESCIEVTCSLSGRTTGTCN